MNGRHADRRVRREARGCRSLSRPLRGWAACGDRLLRTLRRGVRELGFELRGAGGARPGGRAPIGMDDREIASAAGSGPPTRMARAAEVLRTSEGHFARKNVGLESRRLRKISLIESRRHLAGIAAYWPRSRFRGSRTVASLSYEVAWRGGESGGSPASGGPLLPAMANRAGAGDVGILLPHTR